MLCSLVVFVLFRMYNHVCYVLLLCKLEMYQFKPFGLDNEPSC